MTVIAIIPALFAIIGLLAYFVSANPKVSTAGLWTFGAGLLVTLYVFATHVVRL